MYIYLPSDEADPLWCRRDESFIDHTEYKIDTVYEPVENLTYPPGCHWWDVLTHDIGDEVTVHGLDREKVQQKSAINE